MRATGHEKQSPRKQMRETAMDSTAGRFHVEIESSMAARSRA
jgi:hypothetical protein